MLSNSTHRVYCITTFTLVTHMLVDYYGQLCKFQNLSKMYADTELYLFFFLQVAGLGVGFRRHSTTSRSSAVHVNWYSKMWLGQEKLKISLSTLWKLRSIRLLCRI